MKKKLSFIILLVFCVGYAHAHSGGTDKYGCHTKHKNGARHCH